MNPTKSADPIKIILVDDHKLVRESMGLLLDSDPRFSVIKACDNGHDAIEQAKLLNPDLVLLDINMSPLNGFEVAEKILEHNPDLKIIALSVNNLPSYATRMISLGVKGYMTKSSSFDEIAHAIMEVSNGRQYIATEVRNMIL